MVTPSYSYSCWTVIAGYPTMEPRGEVCYSKCKGILKWMSSVVERYWGGGGDEPKIGDYAKTENNTT